MTLDKTAKEKAVIEAAKDLVALGMVNVELERCLRKPLIGARIAARGRLIRAVLALGVAT